MSTQLSKITFIFYIATLTKNSPGRKWVFDDIARSLRQKDQRFFILTGETGVGKSTIAAYLLQTCQDIVAHHFC